MINGLPTNFAYLLRVCDKVAETMHKPVDTGRLALGTQERKEQEIYFGEGREPEENNNEI